MKKDIQKEDLKLIQNILQGDKKAEDKFYLKYLKIIGDFLKSKFPMLDDDTIKDCTSEILIKLHLNLNKYDFSKANVKTWVLIIAKNYMIDIYRQHQNCITYTAGNTITLDGCDSVGFLTSSNLDGEIHVTNNGYTTSCTTNFENCNTLTYILSQVNTTDYQLLNMKYTQGYNYNEIGAEFNLSSNTISNRVNYVKSKLKKNNKEMVII